MTRGVPIIAAATVTVPQPGNEDDPQLRILGPHGRALEAVLKKVHDEAAFEALPRERVGLYVATGMVDSAPDELVPAVEASTVNGELDMERFFKIGYRAIHPLWPLSMLGNVAVGQIATDLDIRGDNLVLAPDAAAGVRAIIEAYYAVEDGLVDGALVAGVDEAPVPAAQARHCDSPHPVATAVALGGTATAKGVLRIGGAGRSASGGPAAAATALAHALENAENADIAGALIVEPA